MPMPMPPSSPDRDLYTIPLSSSWFRWDEIHETERRSLPEFFDGSSFSRNPRVYREYRDFIISKFREDPSRRLTFTDVRKSLAGDVGTLHRVFQCLDRWGLINFGVDGGGGKRGKIDGGKGPAVVVEEGVPLGVKVVPAAAGSGRDLGGGIAVGGNGFRLPPLTSYSDVFGEFAMRNGPVCGSCGDQCVSGKCKAVKDGFAKCIKCFGNKNIKEEKPSVDSKPNNVLDGANNHVTSAWTDAETLLLLEAVLKHGDDWDLIAQHVRTKNKPDCIAWLIQLPFGEHMLGASNNKFENKNSSREISEFRTPQCAPKEESKECTKTDGKQNTDTDNKEGVVEASSLERPFKRTCFPSFTDATDSLMKQVAGLSAVAGPFVAAEAAEAAVAALCHENICARKAFETDETDENEVANDCEPSTANNEPESDAKVEDCNSKRQPETEVQNPVLEKNFGATTFRIRGAIATALGATAARAKLLADQEEREMELLLASVIDTQLRKMKIKMKHFEELEHIMEKEYTQIQNLKESILEEWVNVLQQAFHAGIPRWREHGFPRSMLNTTL